MTGMSQQQNTSQSRQPTSYPSPHSYPSPSMSAYAYPAPQQQQNVEPYRASPTGSHVSLPSLNLPPIRSIDPRQPQQQQVGMGSPLPPPGGQVPAYYGQQHQNLPPPGHQHPNVTSSPHHQGMRYQLPNDSRIMSGGRHKKEIKRRTKTGCLTCRKRRIKVSLSTSDQLFLPHDVFECGRRSLPRFVHHRIGSFTRLLPSESVKQARCQSSCTCLDGEASWRAVAASRPRWLYLIISISPLVPK